MPGLPRVVLPAPTLLAKVLVLLLLVIVPMSVLASAVNYDTESRQLKSLIQAQQQAWTSARRDALATTLVQEVERLEAQGQDPLVRASVQPGVPDTTSLAEADARWQAAGPTGDYRYEFIYTPVGASLSAYRQQFPNRAFALLARSDGRLVAVTTPRWPALDLHQFAWWPRTPLRDQVVIVEAPPIAGFDQRLILILTPVGATLGAAQDAGLLVVGLSLEQIAQPLLTQGLPEGESAWLATGDGQVLSGSADHMDRLPPAWLQTLAPTESGSSEVDQGSTGAAEPTVLAYAPLALSLGYAQNDRAAIAAVNRLGWVVLRAAPQRTAYAGLGSQLTTLIVGIVVVFASLLGIVLVIVRVLLLRPIRTLDRAMSAVAAGDLSVRVTRRSRDELGRLGQRFNQMAADLDTLLRERVERQREQQRVSAQLQNSAAALQNSVAQQNTFTAQQASALAEIAATFNQLSQSANRIAGFSEQIAQATGALHSEQAQGNQALAQTQAVLHRLRSDSESLGQIAGSLSHSSGAIGTVIEELNKIAQETSLLALNATIESAAAGLAGRRFAVIAHEVRALANQSNAAAEVAQDSLSEVRASIDQAIAAIQRELDAIGEGVVQSARLEGLMHTISDTIGKLNESVATIKQDSGQQKDGSAMAARTVAALAGAGQDLVQQSTSLIREAVQLGALAGRLEGAPDAGAAGDDAQRRML